MSNCGGACGGDCGPCGCPAEIYPDPMIDTQWGLGMPNPYTYACGRAGLTIPRYAQRLGDGEGWFKDLGDIPPWEDVGHQLDQGRATGPGWRPLAMYAHRANRGGDERAWPSWPYRPNDGELGELGDIPVEHGADLPYYPDAGEDCAPTHWKDVMTGMCLPKSMPGPGGLPQDLPGNDDDDNAKPPWWPEGYDYPPTFPPGYGLPGFPGGPPPPGGTNPTQCPPGSLPAPFGGGCTPWPPLPGGVPGLPGGPGIPGLPGPGGNPPCPAGSIPSPYGGGCIEWPPKGGEKTDPNRELKIGLAVGIASAVVGGLVTYGMSRLSRRR